MTGELDDFPIMDSGVDVTPLDGGFTEFGVPLDDGSCKFGCRPVTDDNKSLIGILFGPDNLLEGDVDELSKAVLRYQITGDTGGRSREVLNRLYFGWVDAPSVVPVVRGYVPSASRWSGNYYSGLPDLSNVSGLFFASSSSINYLLDHDIDLTSQQAAGYGLYVPIQSCPAI